MRSSPLLHALVVALIVACDGGELAGPTRPVLLSLRLAAADEDYVLSAANLGVPTAEMESPRMLVSVRLLGTGDAAASTLASSNTAIPAMFAP